MTEPISMYSLFLAYEYFVAEKLKEPTKLSINSENLNYLRIKAHPHGSPFRKEAPTELLFLAAKVELDENEPEFRFE